MSCFVNVRKSTMIFATWYVCGMRTSQGEVVEKFEKTNIDICVFAESRKLPGTEAIGEYRHLYEVSAALHKRRGNR